LPGQAHGAIPARPLTEHIMGKYVLGWFLGIPLGVLVILYLIFH
jgi:hypothetical protein